MLAGKFDNAASPKVVHAQIVVYAALLVAAGFVDHHIYRYRDGDDDDDSNF